MILNVLYKGCLSTQNYCDSFAWCQTIKRIDWIMSITIEKCLREYEFQEVAMTHLFDVLFTLRHDNQIVCVAIGLFVEVADSLLNNRQFLLNEKDSSLSNLLC